MAGYVFRCWKRGTKPIDGVNFTAATLSEAVKKFCSSWNLHTSEALCALAEDVLK